MTFFGGALLGCFLMSQLLSSVLQQPKNSVYMGAHVSKAVSLTRPRLCILVRAPTVPWSGDPWRASSAFEACGGIDAAEVRFALYSWPAGFTGYPKPYKPYKPYNPINPVSPKP